MLIAQRALPSGRGLRPPSGRRAPAGGHPGGLYCEPVWTRGVLGALNLYSPLPAVFGAGERARARIYADQAAITLAAVLRWSSRVTLTV